MFKGLEMRAVLSLTTAILFCSVAGCATRSQSMQSWVREQGGLVSGARQQRVQAVANRLAAHVVDRPVTAHVLACDGVCAYSWRDGNVFVTRGLVDRLDDAELAAAVAHELGHLLGDGRVRPVVSLRGCSDGLDDEARADALGIEVLAAQGLPPQAMARMLAKVRDSGTLPPDCRRDMDRRILLLAEPSGDPGQN